MIRKLVPVIALAVVALLAISVGASAHKKRFATDVTAAVVDKSGQSIEIAGAVKSPKKGCLGGRRVVATKVDPLTVSTTVVGRAVTDSTGAFRFPIAKEAGKTIVLLEVKQRRIGPKTKKHRHICESASTGVPT